MLAFILIRNVVMNWSDAYECSFGNRAGTVVGYGMSQSRKFQWSKIVMQLLSFYKQLLKAEGAMR